MLILEPDQYLDKDVLDACSGRSHITSAVETTESLQDCAFNASDDALGVPHQEVVWGICLSRNTEMEELLEDVVYWSVDAIMDKMAEDWNASR